MLLTTYVYETWSTRSRRNPVNRTDAGSGARVVRLLAFAHEIGRRSRAGELNDLAHAARVLGLTRAWVTQIVSLTLLAAAIQEEILAMPMVTSGRDPITERSLREIVAEPVWGEQRAAWRSGDVQRRQSS